MVLVQFHCEVVKYYLTVYCEDVRCNLNSKITLLTKLCVVKVMVFPVDMYRCQSWTIKKAEHQRIDAFKLWC